MARPRRMPPLFEVMKEPLKRVPPEGSAPAHAHPPQQAPSNPPHHPVPEPGPAHTTPSRGGYPNGIHEPSAPLPAREPRTIAVPGADHARSGGEPAHGGPGGGSWEVTVGGMGGAGGRQVVLSTSRLMIALAVVLGGVILIWTIAYKAGRSHEKTKLSPFQTGSEVEDPATPPPTTGSDTRPTTGSREPSTGPRPTQPSNKPQPGTGTKPTGTAGAGGGTGTSGGGNNAPPNNPPAATGGLILDPRQAGLNYLILASLTARDAQAAVDYFKTQQIDVVAFPDRSIDPTKPDAAARLNKAITENEKFWVIYAKGFPGGSRYRESENERSTIRTRIEKAGRTWQRDHKGATDFSATYWQLYKGS